MTPTAPMITNATQGRFLFGTFRMADHISGSDGAVVFGENFIFEGAVVFGSGFSYDPSTGLPIGGTVQRIEVQTRDAETVLAIHSTLPDIAADVQTLNATYTDASTPWFDASDMFKTDTQQPVMPPAADVDDPNDLNLTTGDILTARELKTIARAQDPDPQISTDIDLDGLDDMIVMLNITRKDIPNDDDLLDFQSDDFGALRLTATR